MNHQLTITSKFTNTTYCIEMFVPQSKAQVSGFPVYYVLDGQNYFPFMEQVIRLQHLRGNKTGVHGAIVVGIGHLEEEAREKRFIDFTAPTDTLTIPYHAKGKLPEAYGGAEQFMQFLHKELMPIISQQLNVNMQKQILFGHSLGGYFALWALCNYPNVFHDYIAISPSVWWNGEELLSMANESELTEAKVFIGVGEKEGHMVQGAENIAAILKMRGFDVESYVAQDENHASVVPTVISRAVRFMNQ